MKKKKKKSQSRILNSRILNSIKTHDESRVGLDQSIDQHQDSVCLLTEALRLGGKSIEVPGVAPGLFNFFFSPSIENAST